MRAYVYSAPGERSTCPACGASDLSDLDLFTLPRPIDGRRTGFISTCNDCGLVFSNPQPLPEQLEQLYSPEGHWGRPRVEGGEMAPTRTEGSEGRRRGDGSWARAFDPAGDDLTVTSPPKGAKALDFGCGPGSMLDALQDNGWDTWGIEPSFDAAFHRHHRLESIPTSPTFDLIIANHVLEHLPDPLGVLRELGAAARPSAHLLVGVPRLDTLPRHRDYKYVINGRTHITAYTWDSLRELLGRAGWVPVAPPPDQISKGGGGRQTFSRLRVLARRTTQPVASVPAVGQAARHAIRQFHAGNRTRSLLEQLGWFRIAARCAEARRVRAAKRKP
ncbi:MAG: class I SAM-dependent methyltransferase [Vicinamibacterales bacterium]